MSNRAGAIEMQAEKCATEEPFKLSVVRRDNAHYGLGSAAMIRLETEDQSHAGEFHCRRSRMDLFHIRSKIRIERQRVAQFLLMRFAKAMHWQVMRRS